MNHVVRNIRPRANAKDNKNTQEENHQRIATIHIEGVPKLQVGTILRLLAREECPWPVTITYL
jgi:hypothetical protein